MPLHIDPPGLSGLLWALDGPDSDLAHRLTLLGLAIFSAAWVTALGAAVGSFLNVVIYRLPQGMSLVRPKSRCPSCGTPIRAGDNVPVFGWLRLRGRCRACGEGISSRYPLVEAVTAVLFLGLAHVELFTGGANLPGGPETASGIDALLWHVRPAMIGLYLYHAALLCLALCLSLIIWDGFRPPRSLVVIGLLIGLLVPVIVTIARPVPSGVSYAWLPAATLSIGAVTLSFAAIVEGALGLLAGTLVGTAVSIAIPIGSRSAIDRMGTVALGSLIGLFLGWQSVISCGLAAAGLSIVNALASRFANRSLPVTSLLAMTLLIQIPFWRDLGRLAWWPNQTGWELLRHFGWPETAFVLTSLAAALAATGVVAGLACGVTGRRLQ